MEHKSIFSKYKLSFIVFILFFSSVIYADNFSIKYTPTVNKLVDIINNNLNLKNSLQALLHDTKAKEWQGKNLDDFYKFFNDWQTFNETPDTVQQYINPVYDLLASQGGKSFFTSPLIVNWVKEFMIARGAYMDSFQSTYTLGAWLNDPEIRINDYIIPDQGFKSFNDFFTRQIKKELRPVSQEENQVVDPADGFIWIAESNINTNKKYMFKNDFMSIPELLDNDSIAHQFIGGQAVIVYLQSIDYHHFWSILNGVIIKQKQVGGFYIADGDPNNVANHRRAYTIFKSNKFGYVAMIVIGIYDISSIKLNYNVGDVVKNGTELGNFAYGGSEIVLLFQKDAVKFLDSITNKSHIMKVGQTIGFAKFKK